MPETVEAIVGDSLIAKGEEARAVLMIEKQKAQVVLEEVRAARSEVGGHEAIVVAIKMLAARCAHLRIVLANASASNLSAHDKRAVSHVLNAELQEWEESLVKLRNLTRNYNEGLRTQERLSFLQFTPPRLPVASARQCCRPH